MKRPDFCGGLTLGIVLCTLGGIISAFGAAGGVALLINDRVTEGTFLLSASIASLINCIVYGSILRALLWLIDFNLHSLSGELTKESVSEPEARVVHDDDGLDGVRNKPTLRRRRFSGDR